MNFLKIILRIVPLVAPFFLTIYTSSAQIVDGGAAVEAGTAETSATPGKKSRQCKRNDSLQLEPLNFRDVDNQLRDCDIPFEELTTRSPFCHAEKFKNGSRCERFSYSQFPEVVKVTVNYSESSFASCSGTLISPSWVLTAAHCFLGEKPTSFYTRSPSKDFIWIAAGGNYQVLKSAIVDSPNAKMIENITNRQRTADRVLVFGKYGGLTPSPPFFDNDLALVHLRSPYSVQAVQPAQLAKADEFFEDTTIAGYGYSNANGGQFGEFDLTWPLPVVRENGQLVYSIERGALVRSGFCAGDSGGPVFVGRNRGCKQSDVIPECRPRLLEGTISYNYQVAGHGATEAMRNATACRESNQPLVMLDITTTERHNWICSSVKNDADGCP